MAEFRVMAIPRRGEKSDENRQPLKNVTNQRNHNTREKTPRENGSRKGTVGGDIPRKARPTPFRDKRRRKPERVEGHKKENTPSSTAIQPERMGSTMGKPESREEFHKRRTNAEGTTRGNIAEWNDKPPFLGKNAAINFREAANFFGLLVAKSKEQKKRADLLSFK
jgi:hypothetical protein